MCIACCILLRKQINRSFLFAFEPRNTSFKLSRFHFKLKIDRLYLSWYFITSKIGYRTILDVAQPPKTSTILSWCLKISKYISPTLLGAFRPLKTIRANYLLHYNKEINHSYFDSCFSPVSTLFLG